MIKKDKKESYLILSAFFLYLTIILFSFSIVNYNFYIFITGLITCTIGIYNLKKISQGENKYLK